MCPADSLAKRWARAKDKGKGAQTSPRIREGAEASVVARSKDAKAKANAEGGNEGTTEMLQLWVMTERLVSRHCQRTVLQTQMVQRLPNNKGICSKEACWTLHLGGEAVAETKEKVGACEALAAARAVSRDPAKKKGTDN